MILFFKYKKDFVKHAGRRKKAVMIKFRLDNYIEFKEVKDLKGELRIM